MYQIIDETVPPAVSVAEVKNHLRISHTAEDQFLPTYIASATRFVEAYGGIRLIQRQLKLRSAVWRSGYSLPGPIVEFTSATAGGLTVDLPELQWDGGSYLIWPRQYIGPFEIEAKVGVAADVAALPAEFKAPVLAAVGHLYINREGQEWPAGLIAQIRSLKGLRF